LKKDSRPLKVFEGRTPTRSFFTHIDILKNTDLKKLKIALEEITKIWKMKQEGRSVDDDLKQLAEKSEIQRNDIDSLFEIVPFMGITLAAGRCTEEDIGADLTSLNLTEDLVKWFLSFLQNKKDLFEEDLIKRRDFTMPRLSQVEYRVDLKLKSSDKPTLPSASVLVLLRLSFKKHRFELNSEDLDYLIGVLQSAKTDLTKAQSMIDEGKLSSLYESFKHSY
jgi:hypothetical protein